MILNLQIPGLTSLRGKILRLGHLGWVQPPEIDDAIRALRRALAEAGQTDPTTKA